MDKVIFTFLILVVASSANIFAQTATFDQDSYKIDRYKSNVYFALSNKDNLAEKNKKNDLIMEFVFSRYVKKWNPDWLKSFMGSKYSLSQSQIDYMIDRGKYMCQSQKALQAVGSMQMIDGTAIVDDLERILKATEERQNSYEDWLERNKDKYK